jgi:hypothetical protein
LPFFYCRHKSADHADGEDQGGDSGRGKTDWGDLIPRLQRFFGGRLEEWLELPLRWLNAYAEMLPRLRAEESMRAVTEIQLGEGRLTDESRDEIWAAWQEAADPGHETVIAEDSAWP